MTYKVFMHLASHVEHQLGNNTMDLEAVFALIEQAKERFKHLDIHSFEVYKLTGSLPFKLPTDSSNTQS